MDNTQSNREDTPVSTPDDWRRQPRKHASRRKSTVIYVRATAKEKAKLLEKAGKQELSLSEYVLESALKRRI